MAGTVLRLRASPVHERGRFNGSAGPGSGPGGQAAAAVHRSDLIGPGSSRFIDNGGPGRLAYDNLPLPWPA